MEPSYLKLQNQHLSKTTNYPGWDPRYDLPVRGTGEDDKHQDDVVFPQSLVFVPCYSGKLASAEFKKALSHLGGVYQIFSVADDTKARMSV